MRFLIVCAAIAVTASALPADDAGKPMTARGQITELQTESLILKTTDGRELRLEVDGRSKLRHSDRDSKLSQFKAGMQVQVAYEVKDGKNRVVTMADTSTTDDLKRQIREALAAAKTYSFQQKKEYQKKLEETLAEVDKQIQKLKEQAKEASADAQKEYAQELEELRKQREVVQQKLDKVKTASAEAWDDVKEGVSNAMEDLQKAFERARSRFK